ncbi:hypothetical protein HK44_020625 [Pseudomonas fluorescens HK44]|uniref:Uncharacterized protein n=1 Tax=Pseudomonas fluorescens HK44 TaxID=1042209 RepID=A0A010TGU2_PSEFL|nr:hypothetical protein [Pseudomonas fluorescens]EXF96287.1 hypothetical protein HK44_020625 [Pseudomonas fluorescens HK44]
MSDKTIQVKPWGEGQGDFVIINEDDFNEDFHELLEAKKPTAKEVKAAKLLVDTQAALTAKGVAFGESDTQEQLQALLDAAQ